MKKIILLIALLLGIIALTWAAIFYSRNVNLGPIVRFPPQDITEIINTTGMPLILPPGFEISIFAKDLTGARVMVFDAKGNLWVSRTSEGAVTRLEVRNGKVVGREEIFRDLRKPHGLAFDQENPDILYIAEEHRLSRINLVDSRELIEIMRLPYGGGHFTRTIGFGSDGRLYISIGSSCNVCIERDVRRAKIFSVNKDGSDFKEYARGLRNAVFFTRHPITSELWATEMGRDLLGDNLPPDEVNIVTQGKNYGWPNCYGKNIHDSDFDKNTYIRNPCEEPFEMASHLDLPAHSAPLGLAFVPEESLWPEEYRYNLIIAYHGSWNRSIPDGYKLVRARFDENGNLLELKDFITGWLVDQKAALGRPVDIKFFNGALYLSDDKAGVIYRIDRIK